MSEVVEFAPRFEDWENFFMKVEPRETEQVSNEKQWTRQGDWVVEVILIG